MATAQKQQTQQAPDPETTAEAGKEVRQFLDKAVRYVPLGQSETLELTAEQVKNFLCVKTKSGKEPSRREIVKFMMLCKARNLDPWVGDAFLVGYDAKDGPVFSLITSQLAFYSRAEAHEQYDGLESGLIVMRKAGKNDERHEIEGEVCLPGDVVIGAWCKVYRKDRSRPTRRDINLKAYQKPTSVWSNNRNGMLAKCARVAGLREAFPTVVGDMYIQGEIDASAADAIPEKPEQAAASPLKALTEQMKDDTETTGGELFDKGNPVAE